MPTLLTRPFTHDEARSVAAWAYPPPFDLYDVDPANTNLFTDRDPDGGGYYPATDDGAVVAFCVFGPEARVRGQQPQDGVLDVGLGVHPNLTSRGLASGLFEQVAALAWDLFHPRQLRTAVATFNDRSLALCRKAGFTPVRDFTGPGDRPFRELTCDLDPR
ncbi:GNAT family N-acetyltransferase [Kineococcus sp. NBC_00420]|uniref:GNAT family N-acetyltransferase n=1 Tax=Kineococcus sp. NBC_00420 TaxID=2903564 RepID=UPI002E1BB867